MSEQLPTSGASLPSVGATDRSIFVTCLGLVFAFFAFAVLVKSGYWLFVATQIVCYLIVALGLNLLAGYAGQISLGHGALLAIGAYTTALAMVDYGWPFWTSALLSIAVTAAAGMTMALPAFRISTWYFALITLAFSDVVNGMLSEWSGFTHAFAGVVGIPMPVVLGRPLDATAFFLLAAGLFVLCFFTIARLVQSRFGRAMIAVRDNPTAALASGASLVQTRMLAFSISAGMAGLAGALFAVQKTVITPDDFPLELSIFFLVAIRLGGAGTLWGPIVGTLVFFLVPQFLDSLQSWRMLIYGVALLVLMIFAPNGLIGASSALIARYRRPGARPTTRFWPLQAQLTKARPGALVELRSVTKQFGGVTAVNSISINSPAGGIHAIVGPNGSGKTTMINLISGFYQCDEGSILLDGFDISRLNAAQIAQLGVGRTFQTPKLLPALTALENTMLGGYAAEASGVFETVVGLPRARREQDTTKHRALAYLSFVGLADRLCEPAGELPHGQQRLLEIARALIGQPKLLLLDEPAAGLSMTELERLSSLLRSIRNQATIIIVEHHLDLVANLCDTVTVMDRGTILASGTPSAVFSDPAVIKAYMGARSIRIGSPEIAEARI